MRSAVLCLLIILLPSTALAGSKTALQVHLDKVAALHKQLKSGPDTLEAFAKSCQRLTEYYLSKAKGTHIGKVNGWNLNGSFEVLNLPNSLDLPDAVEAGDAAEKEITAIHACNLVLTGNCPGCDDFRRFAVGGYIKQRLDRKNYVGNRTAFTPNLFRALPTGSLFRLITTYSYENDDNPLFVVYGGKKSETLVTGFEKNVDQFYDLGGAGLYAIMCRMENFQKTYRNYKNLDVRCGMRFQPDDINDAEIGNFICLPKKRLQDLGDGSFYIPERKAHFKELEFQCGK